MEKSKSKKTLIIVSCIAAVIALVIAIVVVMGSKGRELKKCLNLGQKYLSEMNYEEAIAYFEKAVEIDPMSVDAYLGIADAYIGIADGLFADGDIEGANAALDEARDNLEKGIEVFTKYVKDNAGKDADSAKSDIKRLEDKLEEIEQFRKEHTPLYGIKALIDELDSCIVWGKRISEWTVEDYIDEYNLIRWEDEDLYLSDKNCEECFAERMRRAFADEPIIQMDDGFTYRIEQSIEDGKRVYFPYYYDERIEIQSEIKAYYQTISSTDHDVPTDGIYRFCIENGITSPRGAIEYLGISDISLGQPVEIETGYGRAQVTLETDENGNEVLLVDGFSHDVHMYIVFSYYGNGFTGITDFSVRIVQSK